MSCMVDDKSYHSLDCVQNYQNKQVCIRLHIIKLSKRLCSEQYS